MKKFKILVISVLTISVFSCDDEKKSKEPEFRFDGSVMKELYRAEDRAELQIVNAQGKKIDSIEFFVNGKKAGSVKGAGKLSVPLAGSKLGYQNLKAIVHAEGKASEVSDRIEVVSSVEPKLLKYELVNMYPHDTKSFTEGLEFYRDTLYEGTGQHGTSYLRKYDYKTGKVYKQVDLEQQYFGEGITVLNGKVYQLTYKTMTGFIYDAGSFKKEKSFTYDKQIEGWGMTNDGTHIYHSDGTEKIWKMDPATQKMIDYVNVYSTSGKIKSVNELEYVDGKIYGNIWMKDAIAVINPQTGAVEGILNLADLRKKVGNAEAEVLNGIAWNPKTKTFFVTGKHWDKLFEIRVTQ